MEDEFNKLFSCVITLKNDLKVPRAFNAILDQHVLTITSHFNSVNSIYDMNNDYNKFQERRIGEIYIIYDTTVGIFAQNYSNRTYIMRFRPVVDKFIQTKLKLKNLDKIFRTIPTKIFTEFCKGITYFNNEVQKDKWPIYHRNVSCGNSGLNANIKFKITNNNVFQTVARKKSYLKRCYLE